MSKIKQRGQIEGTTRLYKQTCRGKEIAPLYIKSTHQTLLAAETDAMIQASNAGYRCVTIQTASGRPRQISVYVLTEGNAWKQADWAFGKWGKLNEKDKGGIFKRGENVNDTNYFARGIEAMQAEGIADPVQHILKEMREFSVPALASPLAGANARIESVTPLWPEVDSPEIDAMAARLAELVKIEPLPPYDLQPSGV